MPVPDGLRRLLTAAGPSGYERAPAAVFCRRSAGRSRDDVSVDVMGSAIARVPGTQPGAPLLAIVGHIDEIGLDRHAHRRRRLPELHRRRRLGPADPRRPARRAAHARGHRARRRRQEADPPPARRGAQEGPGDARPAPRHRRAGRRRGDAPPCASATSRSSPASPVELLGDRVISRSMDNRLGSFIALEAARLVAEGGGAPGDVAALGVVQEEITFGGARTSAFGLEPDVAIAVDVTHATGRSGHRRQGAGQARVRRRSGHRARLDRSTRWSSRCCTTRPSGRASRSRSPASARAHGDRRRRDPLQPRGRPDRAWSRSRLRYMHSPVEMVQLSDIDACARLIAAFATSLSPETKFVR